MPFTEAQAQQQKQLQGPLGAGKQQLPSASASLSQEPLKSQAKASAVQHPEPDPDIDLGLGPEPDQDVSISQRSHVSPSPSSCRTGRSDKGLAHQSPQPSEDITLADSAAQSSKGTWASQGKKDVRPYSQQPIQSLLPNQLTAAATSSHGQLQPSSRDSEAASPKDLAAEPRLASGTNAAVMEPAGPLLVALQGRGSLPITSGSDLQLPKSGKQGSAALMQQHNVTPQVAGSKRKLQAAAGKATKDQPRNALRVASVGLAESQQSAVRLGDHGPCSGKHAQHLDTHVPWDSMQATGFRAGLDGQTASSKAKRSRPAADVADAKKQAVEQSRKCSRPRLQAVCHAGSSLELEMSAPQAADGKARHNDAPNLGRLQEHVDHYQEEDKNGVPAGTSGKDLPPADHSSKKHSNGKCKVDMDSRISICGRGVQSAKRSLRKRDGDGNKPWWVV